MLKINIICIGKIKEKYFSEAIAEYSKRLGAFCKLQIVELAEERIRDNNPNASQIDEVLKAEGRRIMLKISPSDFVAAMCIEGKQLSSEELSDKLDKIALSGKSTVDFVIGGSYGLSDEVKSRADLKLHEPNDVSAHNGKNDSVRTNLQGVRNFNKRKIP